VLQAFARQAREGAFECKKQVQIGSIQAALCTIAKKIKLAGYPNPLNKPGTTNYHAILAMKMRHTSKQTQQQ